MNADMNKNNRFDEINSNEFGENLKMFALQSANKPAEEKQLDGQRKMS